MINDSNVRVFSKLLIVWLMLMATFFSACEEDDGYIPPFTCQVNGEEWRPDSRLGQLSLFTYSINDYLSIGADNEDSGISLVLKDSTGIKVDNLYDLSDDSGSYARYNIAKDDRICHYKDIHILSGTMLITKLDSKSIIGTFEFTSYNPDCGDTIKVTEGRLHINEITK